jgi:AraC-like DNA-binding protein
MGKPRAKRLGNDIFLVLSELLRQIQADLDAPWTLGSLAERSGYDAHYLAHAFRDLVGRSPMQYVLALRLERAAHDLIYDTDKNLLEIALEAGYSSEDAFRRAFIRRYGRPPIRVRRRQLPRFQVDPLPVAAPVDLAEAPRGLLAQPAIERFGPITTVSLHLPRFTDQIVAEAWPLFYAELLRSGIPTPFRLGGITSPWGWIMLSDLRDYRCICLVDDPPPPVRPPLVRWQMEQGVYARFAYRGDTPGMLALIDWIFQRWMPARAFRFAYRPFVVLSEDQWSVDAGGTCSILAPVERVGLSVFR